MAVKERMIRSKGLGKMNLALEYTTYYDPRLNEKRAMEIAFLVAGYLGAEDERGL